MPDLGIHWQKLESESLGRYLGSGTNAEQAGILVTHVLHGGASEDLIQAGDVIVTIDGHAIAGDGTYVLREGLRVEFSHLISQRQIGDRALVELTRGASSRTVEVTLAPYVALVRSSRPDRRPRYFVAAGLVFQPLTYDYMMIWPWEKVDYRLKYYAYHGLPSKDATEVVILSQVLAHEVNAGYHRVQGVRVLRVNGRRIRSLEDVPHAFEAPSGGFHVIEIENMGNRLDDYFPAIGSLIVLDAEATARASADILRQHGITADRS